MKIKRNLTAVDVLLLIILESALFMITWKDFLDFLAVKSPVTGLGNELSAKVTGLR